MHFNEQSVLVLGAGVSGRSATSFLLKRGAFATLVDGNLSHIESCPEIAALRQLGAKVIHESELSDLASFDYVVVSPGIAQTHPLYKMAIKQSIPVIGEVELGAKELNISKKCLGITGTNGKTTVTLLVEHVLNENGIAAIAIGNNGVPITSVVDDSKASVYVVELSSFQLETLTSACIDAAVILNITPDHLDRYASIEDYAKAKIKIASHLNPNADFIVQKRCYLEYKALFENFHPTLYSESDSSFIDIPKELEGKWHDIENYIASYLLCSYLSVGKDSFYKAFKSFNKPPHRIEFVGEVGGVKFYDDSKGTNLDAVISAVATFSSDIVLIAGGVDKGAPYTAWIDPFNLCRSSAESHARFKAKVKAICAIGKAANRIQEDLGRYVPVALCATLQEAVVQAMALADGKGVVLLSPGCSSYDMFKDYAHRGREFQRLVLEI